MKYTTMNWFKEKFEIVTGIKRRREKKEIRKIRKELEDLHDSIIKDWNATIFSDKVQAVNNQATYRMENGIRITLNQNRTIRLETHAGIWTYTVSSDIWSKFVTTINRIVEIINAGNTATRTVNTKAWTRRKVATEHPKKRIYEVLLENLNLRKAKLSQMTKDDPERHPLEIELIVVERKVDCR